MTSHWALRVRVAVCRRRVCFAVLAAQPAAAAPPPEQYVTRSGGTLMLGGAPFRFTGMNIYNANWANGEMPPTTWITASSSRPSPTSASAASTAGDHGVIRAWFFQPLATPDKTGPRDWTRFDRTIAAAKAAGYYVIPTLGNQWGECGHKGATAGYKRIDWYRTGYTQLQPEDAVYTTYASYRDWVAEVVARYKDEPAILAWQLERGRDERRPARWMPGRSGGIRRPGPVGERCVGADQVDRPEPSRQPRHDRHGAVRHERRPVPRRSTAIPTIDLCEYHDYDPWAAMPGDAFNGLALRIQQCGELGKPLFVGEVGLRPVDVGGTVEARAAMFEAKLSAQFAAGVAGELAWAWEQGRFDAGRLRHRAGRSEPRGVRGALTRRSGPCPRSLTGARRRASLGRLICRRSRGRMMVTRTSRARARLAVLAVVAGSSALALGGPAREAAARTTSGAQPCASVTLSDPDCGQARPVPSLQPQATRRVLQHLASARQARTLRLAAAGTCRPLRAVFYTATDWMRLATKLAANASPCAQYFFSIPSLAADHTQIRADQAWRIRALGPQFHAMAEVSMGAWGKWVTSTGSTWYQAGVEARRRMAVAGYDVALGDTWAVNEFSSAVRQGTSTARADARNFVRGLAIGDGTRPPFAARCSSSAWDRTRSTSPSTRRTWRRGWTTPPSADRHGRYVSDGWKKCR